MKRILFFAFLITSLYVINNLAHSIYENWRKGYLVEEAKVKLEKVEKEHALLQKQLSEAQTSAFVEKEARNKLLLGKSKEQEVIVSKALLPKSDQILGVDTQPKWQKWWKLFF